jgi:hypothetical protein
MACAITSLIMLAAIGVLAVGFTAFSGPKQRPEVREDKTPNSSRGGPVIA